MKRIVICMVFFVTAVVPATWAQGQLTTLYTFTGPDGSVPTAGLFRGAAGNLYGTTYYGGAFGFGVVFKLDTNNNETVLHSFTGGSDGAYPYGGVVGDSAGNLYGTTTAGGDPTCQCGTVFKVSSSGVTRFLYRFHGGTDGSAPYDGVILDSAGNLYGTTTGGGHDYGTVFEVSPSGIETVLYRFQDTSDGGLPSAGVIRDSSGNLYGITGTNDVGLSVVFKLSASNEFRVIGDAAPTAAGLSFCFSGDLCGTYFEAGVWKVTLGGVFTGLYGFPNYNDGSWLRGGVVEDSEGDLYGLASCCGLQDWGVLYEVNRIGEGKSLYYFTGYSDGGYPEGNVILDGQGNLYGTAPAGGDGNCNGYTYGCGVVWKFTP